MPKPTSKIDKVYTKLKTKFARSAAFRKSDFRLASGGIYDSKQPKSYSDVDIVYMDEDYTNLGDIFTGFTKEHQPNNKRCFYKSVINGREVNILATNDEAALRSIKHRETEIMINEKFPLVFVAAIAYKLNGEKTEYAYAKALGIDTSLPENDPYAIMMNKSKIYAIAKPREKMLKTIFDGSLH